MGVVIDSGRFLEVVVSSGLTVLLELGMGDSDFVT
jgi:hypothetical protein